MLLTDQFSTPILFLVFNRPDTTQKVFDSIRSQRPTKLYIAADGPRSGKPNEAEKCNEVRNIVSDIDWDCDVKTLYRAENLGCKVAVSSAISWFFEQEEEGIILEDDCLPDDTFYNYCSLLLEKYRFDDKVMHIGGVNFQNGVKRGKGSYYLSDITHIWGWASWRRAWKHYDVNTSRLNEYLNISHFIKILLLPYFNKMQIINYINTNANKIDTWDHQWAFAIELNRGTNINPNVNLIENIGFGDNATHTQEKSNSLKQYMHNGSIDQMIHPDVMIVNLEADTFFKNLTKPTNLLSSLKLNIKIVIAVLNRKINGLQNL